MSTKAFLTVTQVAEKLNMPAKAVRRAMRRQDMPGVKIGQQWRMDPRDLDTYIASVTSATPFTVQDEALAPLDDISVSAREERLYRMALVHHMTAAAVSVVT